ncbi:MAG: hypothetical protein WBA46_00910, partial [Thermomicrobiales bacterium]
EGSEPAERTVDAPGALELLDEVVDLDNWHEASVPGVMAYGQVRVLGDRQGQRGIPAPRRGVKRGRMGDIPGRWPMVKAALM